MKALNKFSTRLKLIVGSVLCLAACWLVSRGEVRQAVRRPISGQTAVVAATPKQPAVALHTADVALTAPAQTSGTLSLLQTVLAGGGGESSGGSYSIAATIGQSVTDTSTGGAYALQSGFWPQGITGGGCTFAASPTTQPFPGNGGSGSVNVLAAAGCEWVAQSNDAWITIDSGSSGSGSGTVNFSVALDPGSARTGTLTVAGQTVTINQNRPTASCAYTLAPGSASLPAFGGTGNILVQASVPSCTWAAVSNAPWITITSGISGTGNGAVSYAVPSNPDSHPRTGTLTIGGQTFTVTQATASCQATLTLTSDSFAANGGKGTITLPFGEGCSWNAIASDPWITFTSASNGSGPATLTYSVAAHTAQGRRAGTIQINGQSFSVLQGAQFLDVPLDHPFYTFIGKLSARGVTSGCGYGNYCPDANVTREQMAAFLIRSLGEFNPPQPAQQRFSDVPLTSSFSAFIEQLAVRGITSGCGGGNYCPAANATREAMAAFIIRGLHAPGYAPAAPATQRFSDVPLQSSFAGFIEELAARGITSGCGGGNYCPANNITRAQMAAFLVRAFGL